MKSLQQVIHAVQYELDCSISELSRKLGKSRNYLNTTMKKGLSQEKEQELIEKLLDFVDDENAMLRRELSETYQLLMAYRIKSDSGNKEIGRLQDIITTKDLFIDGQDKEIDDLKNHLVFRAREIQEREKSLEALAKAGHSTSALLRKAETKNRILIGALIGMGLLWAVSVWVMS